MIAQKLQKFEVMPDVIPVSDRMQMVSITYGKVPGIFLHPFTTFLSSLYVLTSKRYLFSKNTVEVDSAVIN